MKDFLFAIFITIGFTGTINAQKSNNTLSAVAVERIADKMLDTDPQMNFAHAQIEKLSPQALEAVFLRTNKVPEIAALKNIGLGYSTFVGEAVARAVGTADVNEYISEKVITPGMTRAQADAAAANFNPASHSDLIDQISQDIGQAVNPPQDTTTYKFPPAINTPEKQEQYKQMLQIQAVLNGKPQISTTKDLIPKFTAGLQAKVDASFASLTPNEQQQLKAIQYALENMGVQVEVFATFQHPKLRH